MISSNIPLVPLKENGPIAENIGQPQWGLTTLTNDKLTWFSLLWAVASLIHILSFSDRLTSSNPVLWLVLLATTAVIMFPGSVYLFMVMLLFRIVDYVYWMPFTPNHLLFEFILNIGMLSALVYRVFLYTSPYQLSGKNFSKTDYREELFNFFRPVATVSLIILYFYAVFHKLNFDFFNPAISCGTYLMEYFTYSMPTINNNYFIRMSAVWGTLLFEGGIPILLCFRKTRTAGIVIGLFFHYFLAIHPHRGIYSFSALVFSLYFLFLPDNFIERIFFTGKNIFGNYWRKLIRAVTYARLLLPVAILPVIFFLQYNWPKLVKLGLYIWLTWGVLIMVVYLTVTLSNKSKGIYARSLFRIPAKALWIFPVIIFLNGLNPYLGFKTQTSFSMFSNLRTEDQVTNHLFVPASLQVDTLQHNLVDIISSDSEELMKYKIHNQLITFFEFRRITSALKKDFYVNYSRNGQPQVLQVKYGQSNQPELLTPHPWLLSKLLAFRPIDKGPCLCKH